MGKQICTRCVMDNVGDHTIGFNSDGTCNYCSYALSRINQVYYPNAKGKDRLKSMIRVLKEQGKNRDYDCLMGLSGGLDSSYLAFLGARKWGLRILAIHVDDGFDSDIAKNNILNLCNKLHIKLIIEKPNKNQYMDLIKSFIRAEVPGIANPQDNILLAYLKNYAKENQLEYFLSGANFALESILQRGNAHNAADGTHIKDIHRRFGEIPISDLKLITLFERYIGQKYFDKIKTLRPLDFIDYNNKKAINDLKDNVGFNYYGGKHYESIFTKFVQVYYLPNKFGVDKRKSHLSSLIISGQMTREKALNELEKPLYDEYLMEQDINYILNQISMSRTEFDQIMSRPGKPHKQYKTSVLANFAKIARKYRGLLSD